MQSYKKNRESKSYYLGVSLFYIGFGSVISQILLVREFFVSFYGNELSIGIVFGGWLAWIGVGSIAGNWIIKKKNVTRKFFAFLLASTPIITFIQLLIIKSARLFFNITAGAYLSISELVIFALFVLSFGCFLWGMLFTLGAKFISSDEKELWFGVNKAYVIESFGSFIGGMIFSFLLCLVFSTMQIILLLTLFAFFVSINFLLFKYVWLKIIIAISIFVISLNQMNEIERQINKHQWRIFNDKLSFVKSVNTKYQNLALLQLDDQYTIYVNGKPAYNIPNDYDAEIFTHSIMVHKTDAQNVLLIGGGFNGVVKELLKYEHAKIDYLEIDSDLIQFAEQLLDEHDREALKNKRVSLIYSDGRDYLNKNEVKYDVIILNSGDPSTASLNRFFTLEFYKQCKLRLSETGIMAFSLQSSSEYLSEEMKDLNASIYHTLKHVFDNVLIIPGTRAIFIASSHNKRLVSNPDSLAKVFSSTFIPTHYFTKYTYEDLMLSERIHSITNLLEQVKEYLINTDDNPIVYYFDLLVWNRLLREDNKMLASITSSRIFISGITIVGALLFLFFFIRKKVASVNKTALLTIIASGGFAGMAINLLLMLNFQQAFGSIYEMVGAMTAANIVGLALGALLISRLSKTIVRKRSLTIILAFLIVEISLMPFIMKTLLNAHLVFLTLFINLLSGMLVGMLFGKVNKFYLSSSFKIGSIYAFDVFGASVGALVTCSILLPILGVNLLVLFLLILMIPAIAACFVLRTEA